MLKEICNSRGIQIAVNDNSRYYSEFNLEALSLDELYAAGYFAEGMRLNRIKAIVQDSEMPQDIRNCFRIILKDEEMTRDEVSEQYSVLLEHQRKIRESIKMLQETCSHPAVTKTHRANTGNYDPSNNSYWTEFKCPDCHKFWTEDGSK